MNQNFVGKPDADDIKVLEGLRRGLLPLIAVLDNLKREMMKSQDGPPDWSFVQRIASALTNHLATLHNNINGRVANEITGVDAMSPAAPKIRSLHPFPMAPFPVEQENLVNLANVLLRKKIEPREEKWTEERLAKAAQFAHVPPEWGIEPKKPAEVREGEREIHDNDSIDIVGDEDMDDDAGTRNVREKGALDEDQLVHTWNIAAEVSIQEYAEYQEEAYKELAKAGKSTGGFAIQAEDEQMKDTDGPKQSAGAGSGPLGAQQPVPQPIMPLATMHRFMTIGAVSGPSGA